MSDADTIRTILETTARIDERTIYLVERADHMGERQDRSDHRQDTYEEKNRLLSSRMDRIAGGLAALIAVAMVGIPIVEKLFVGK